MEYVKYWYDNSARSVPCCECEPYTTVMLVYLQRVIWGTRYEAIPEPLVSWLPQDVAQLAVQVLHGRGTKTTKAWVEGEATAPTEKKRPLGDMAL